MSFIDEEYQALASDRTGPVHGLVVGPRLTAAEFEAMATMLNAASKAGTLPVILFEGETGSNREGTDE